MADDKAKREFEVDGVKYAVRRPTLAELQEANKLRSETFNEALQRGDMLRDQLESELRKRKLWSDGREEEYQELRKSVIDGEFKLKKGGIKLTEAREVGITMRTGRGRLVELLSSRTELDSNTCEGKADAARFNSLFASCLVYDDTGESYFPNGLADYIINQEDPVAIAGATEFYYFISDSDNPNSVLPENKFLKEFNFVNDDYQLIDDNGKLIDEENKHIDAFGNYIKWTDEENFVYVDEKGREVEQGEFKVEFSPFLDDDGNPLVDNSETEEEEKPKPKPKPKARKTRKPKKKTEPTPEPTPEAESETEPKAEPEAEGSEDNDE